MRNRWPPAPSTDHFVQLDNGANISIFPLELLIACADGGSNLLHHNLICEGAFDNIGTQLNSYGVTPLGPIFINDNFRARAILSLATVTRSGVHLFPYYENPEFPTTPTSYEVWCSLSDDPKGLSLIFTSTQPDSRSRLPPELPPFSPIDPGGLNIYLAPDTAVIEFLAAMREHLGPTTNLRGYRPGVISTGAPPHYTAYLATRNPLRVMVHALTVVSADTAIVEWKTDGPFFGQYPIAPDTSLAPALSEIYRLSPAMQAYAMRAAMGTAADRAEFTRRWHLAMPPPSRVAVAITRSSTTDLMPPSFDDQQAHLTAAIETARLTPTSRGILRPSSDTPIDPYSSQALTIPDVTMLSSPTSVVELGGRHCRWRLVVDDSNSFIS
jgi:hypothetical protein